MRWPHLTVVLTSGNAGERVAHLPFGVEYRPKPLRWTFPLRVSHVQPGRYDIDAEIKLGAGSV